MIRRKEKRKALWVLAREAAREGQAPQTPAPAPRKRLSPVSARRRPLLAEYAKARAEYLRRNPRCQCRRPGCLVASSDVHHTRGRAGPLLLDQRFWRPVCRWCHDWIGGHPVEARAAGMLCAEGLWNVPAR